LNIRSYFTVSSISLFFIGLMLILPYLFPYHRLPIQSFYLEWLTALFGLLAFFPLIKQNAWPQYQAPIIIWLPIAIICVMVLQLVVQDIAYWQHYFLVAQYFLFAALLMLLGAMLKQSVGFETTMRAIAIALAISGLLSTTIIYLDIANIRLGGLIINSKLGGAIANVGQQNHLATLLSLAIASLAFLFVKQRISAWLAWPLFTFLLSGVALTSSRSAWIFVVLITLTALAFQRWQAKEHQSIHGASSQRLRVLLMLPVLFYVLQIGLPYLPTEKSITTTNQRLVQLAQNKDSPRLQIYTTSWYIYTSNPLLGAGFGQMAWQDLTHAERVPQLKGTVAQAHNILLQFLAETGVIGTAVLLVCLLAFFLRVKSASITPERWLWWLMLAIIGAHAMLEYPLSYIHFLALTALLVGAGDMQSLSLKSFRPQLLFTIFAMLWVVSLVQTFHDYRAIDYWFHESRKATFTKESFDKMFKQLKPISVLSPFAHQADNIIFASLPTNKDNIKEKLEVAQRLLKINYSALLAYNYVTLLALNGQHETAKHHLNKVYLRYPDYIDTYWQRIVKLTLSEDPALFYLVKHVEHLRDNQPLDTGAPVMMDNSQFNQPAI
jgi:O-antigen ligase